MICWLSSTHVVIHLSINENLILPKTVQLRSDGSPSIFLKCLSCSIILTLFRCPCSIVLVLVLHANDDLRNFMRCLILMLETPSAHKLKTKTSGMFDIIPTNHSLYAVNTLFNQQPLLSAWGNTVDISGMKSEFLPLWLRLNSFLIDLLPVNNWRVCNFKWPLIYTRMAMPDLKRYLLYQD